MNWTCENCGVSVARDSDACWNCGEQQWRSQLLRDAKAQVQITLEPPRVDLKSTFFDMATVFSWVFSFAAYGAMLYSVALCMAEFSSNIFRFGIGGRLDRIVLIMLSCLGLALLSRPFSRSSAIRFAVAGCLPIVLFICLHTWWGWYVSIPASK